MNKKAQANIITTVLIILVILAAIVIIWAVINSVVKSGGETITKQGNCFAVNLEIINNNPGTGLGKNTEFIVKRTGGGTITPEPSIKLIKDGTDKTTDCGWTPVDPDWTQDQFSAICTFTSAATQYVEIALQMTDGTLCPITAKVNI